MQGKLVPQDLHDEPATVLLERIRAEKAELIKEGKIKKEKPLPPIAEDEIPYDLPDGWSACRLVDVVSKVGSGSTPSGGRNVYVSSGVKFLRSQNVYNNGLRLDGVAYITPLIHDRMSGTHVQKKDILLNITGASIGRCCIVPDEFDTGNVNQHVSIIRCVNSEIRGYLHIFLTSPFLQAEIMNQQVGMSREGLSGEKIKKFIIPIPPFAEQQRIVAKVDELMAMCDELEAAENELETLENHFIETLPKSILQMAVQGKLVPQDLHDESAIELLARIRAEKAKLIKVGKLKKEKPLPPIAEDEIPYDLPDGWVWCRLGEVISLLSGRDLETRQFNDTENGIPYITGASAIDGDNIIINRWTNQPVVVSIRNDLLVSCKGTIGKIVANDIGDCHIARQIMAIRFISEKLLPNFIKIFLESYVHQLAIRAKSIIPGISRDDILFAMLPLPPLSEQQRIVAKVDELMYLCNELKTTKNTPIKTIETKVIPFQQITESEEEIGIAARGNMQGLSDEAKKDIDELFGDDGNA